MTRKKKKRDKNVIQVKREDWNFIRHLNLKKEKQNKNKA